MEIPVLQQLTEAAASLLLGFAAGFLYDIFRTVRRIFPYAILTHILDALFWLICAVCLFFTGIALGGGKQRIAMTVLAFLGGSAYFLLLSRFALLLMDKFIKLMAKTAAILSVPLFAAADYIKKILKIAKNIFHYNLKWYKIESKYTLRRPTDRNHGGTTHEEKPLRYSYENPARTAAGNIGNVTDKYERKNKGRRRSSEGTGRKGSAS